MSTSAAKNKTTTTIAKMLAAFLPPVALPVHRSPRTRTRTPFPRAAAQPTGSPSRLPVPPSPKPAVKLSHFENNTFLLQTDSATLLIDPWLREDLIFFTPSFYRARKPSPWSASLDYTKLDVSTVDAIVLTQGLPDHAHPPTLSNLPRGIPVVTPRSAVPLLRSLGYENVIEVTYGDKVAPVSDAAVLITAMRGSVVGPPWSEAQLGFLFEFGDGTPSRVYHEPHGNHDVDALRRYAGKLDAIMAPIVSTTIPVLGNYPIVNGVAEAVEVCRLTKPKVCVTFNNSRVEQTGLLTKFLKQGGGVETFKREIENDASLGDMQILRLDTVKEPVEIVGGEL